MKFSQVGLLKGITKKSSRREHIVFAAEILAIALLIIGFSDPHIPLEQEKEGVSVVLAIDVSGSMQAADYQPSRLEAAKSSAKILLESLEPKDSAGIVVFHTGASTSAYLSPFKDKVIEKLEGIAPRDGQTAIGDGLSLAVDMATSIPNRKKVVILLSDGVNNAGVISPDEAMEFARANRVQVFTVGLGSEEPVVLGYDFFGRAQYAQLDEGMLENIAGRTGGHYYKSVDSKTLDGIYKTISNEIEREKEPTSIMMWFFAAALVVLLVDFYIRYGRFRVVQ